MNRFYTSVFGLFCLGNLGACSGTRSKNLDPDLYLVISPMNMTKYLAPCHVRELVNEVTSEDDLKAAKAARSLRDYLCFYLGEHEKGIVFEPLCLQRCEKLGKTIAQLEFGKEYPNDHKLTIEDRRRLIYKSWNGDSSASHELASYYLRVRQDKYAALAWFTVAAKQGDAESATHVARMQMEFGLKSYGEFAPAHKPVEVHLTP